MKPEAEPRAGLSQVREGLQGSGPKLGPAARSMIREPPPPTLRVLELEGKARLSIRKKQEGITGTNPHLLPFLGMVPAEGIPRGWG